MANEMRHKDVGSNLSQTEWEAIGGHIFNSQATGDMLIATSATQLSRLGITNDRILVSSSGTFSWSNTLPAFTLGGAITGGGQAINGLVQVLMAAAGKVGQNTNDSYLTVGGGTGVANSGAQIWLTGATKAGDPSQFYFLTENAATEQTTRLTITGNINEATAAWTNVIHTGLKLGGALTLNAQDLVSDTTTGTKIATATNQKIGFFGDTPVVQLAKASYGNWAALSDVVNALVAIGLFDVA